MSNGGGYTGAQRRTIATALDADTAPRCPVCDTRLTQQVVEPTPGVAYVRRRVWVLCPGCRRSASVDVRSG